MTVGILTPFAGRHEESGLLYLVANYLRHTSSAAGQAIDLIQLRCNGLFSVCDRDADRDWKRGMHSCLSCAQDQGEHAAWSSVLTVEASPLLPAEVAESTKRFSALLPSAELLGVVYEGHPLFEIWRGSFEARFGSIKPDLSNKQHEKFVRRLVLSTTRMLEVAKRFNNKFQPVLSCVVGCNDYITRAFVAQSALQGRTVATFRWELQERLIKIDRSDTKETVQSELVLEGVTDMRQDVGSWSQPVLEVAENIARFLGVQVPQQVMPLHR
jgi:hypothetical protein